MSFISKLSSSVMIDDLSLVTSIDKSISGLDDDEVLAYELVCRISAPSLHRIKNHFKPRQFPSGPPERDVDGFDIQDANQNVPTYKKKYIERQGFINAIDTILGKNKYSFHAAKLFSLLDPENTGRIWWNDLLDKMMDFGMRKNRSRSDKWSPIDAEKLTIEDLIHCRKDTIVKIIPIETKKSFCYGVVTNTGKIGLYSGHLKLLSEYDLFAARPGILKRVKTTWVTDAVYFEDVKCLAVSTSDRNITIYEASTLWHSPMFLITGITNIPTCLFYEPSRDKNSTSLLFFGDDHGGITTIFFKQPRISLFFKKFVDKMNSYFWIEIQSFEHEAFCEVKVSRRIHTRSVRRVYYCRHSDSIISCSNDPSSSVVMRHRKGIREPYIFKLSKGVLCFHMSPSLNILATGGADCLVRIWDPFVTSHPSVILQGHTKPVIDVVILGHNEVAVSLARNGIVKIWDLLEFDCLQTIRLHFPSFGILGKRIEYGACCIYPGPARKKAAKDLLEAFSKSGSASRRGSRMFVEEGASVLKMATLDVPDDVTRTDNLEVKMESDSEYLKWDRPEIFVVCCNHLATLTFIEQPMTNLERILILDYEDQSSEEVPSPLSPPQKLYRARKPDLWSMADLEVGDEPALDTFITKTIEPEQLISSNFLQIPSCSRDKDLLASLESEKERKIKEMNLEELLNYSGLQGVLQRDFLKGTVFKSDLNAKMALLQDQHEKMQVHISQGAPYMALDLHEVAEVKFSQNLPISDRMKKRSGASHFNDTDIFNKYPSCFSMASPRTSYTVSTSRSDKSRTTANSSSTGRRSSSKLDKSI